MDEDHVSRALPNGQAAELFDATQRGHGVPGFQLVAGPGEGTQSVRMGDLWICRALGEGRLASCGEIALDGLGARGHGVLPRDMVVVRRVPGPEVDDPVGLLLRWGVPGGHIYDPFTTSNRERRAFWARMDAAGLPARKVRRTGGIHFGLDISPTGRPRGEPMDPRRGAPVYVVLKPELDLDALAGVRAVWPKSDRRKVRRLRLRDQGTVELQRARVLRTVFTLPNAYGTVVILLVHYGPAGSEDTTLTLSVEYDHLISRATPPRNHRDEPIAWRTWLRRPPPTTMGPLMDKGTTLNRAQLLTHPLVGPLGATKFPHVHVSVGARSGRRDGLFKSPRIDPRLVLIPEIQRRDLGGLNPAP